MKGNEKAGSEPALKKNGEPLIGIEPTT